MTVFRPASTPVEEPCLHRALLDSIGEAAIATATDGTITAWNRAAESMYGWPAADAIGRNVVDVTPAAISPGDAAAIRARLAHREPWSGELTVHRRDGTPCPALVTNQPILDTADEVIGIAWIARDITVQRAREERIAHVQRDLVDSERGFRRLFDANPHPLIVCDKDFHILEVNAAAIARYGWTREELLAMSMPQLRDPQNPVPFTAVARDLRAGTNHFDLSHHCTKSGEIFDVEVDIRTIHFRGGDVWLALVTDTTERNLLRHELEHLAYHDSLTNVANRALFNERLSEATLAMHDGACAYAVLVINLDDFKDINDTLGLAVGDATLIETASRLQSVTRRRDLVARLGGDSFEILLLDIDGEAGAISAANRYLDALRPPFVVGGRRVTLRGTVGIALPAPDSDVNPRDVVRDADAALHIAKASHRGNCLVYSPSMRSAIIERLTLEQDLRDSLGRGDLFLVYQPKVDTWTGRLEGVEALARWHHPEFGSVPPDRFIPLAEASDLIIDIDGWVLETACRQARAWQLRGGEAVSVAVNISGRELRDGRLLEHVTAVLTATGLAPELLELELTESTAVRQEGAALRELAAIRRLGVRVAIDDFGTGYSMLSRLHDYPIDTLKIDKSFVDRITSVSSAAPLVAATLAMAQGLGLKTVAEGVETTEQRDFLAARGCNLIQGYLSSRPVSAEEIDALRNRPLLVPVAETAASSRVDTSPPRTRPSAA